MKSIHHKDRIALLTKDLRLSIINKEFSKIAKQAIIENKTYEDFLLELLELEYHHRIERRHKERLKRAHFPSMKYLHDLVLNDLPQDAQAKLPLLNELSFLEEKQNVILAGNPGTGKTHMAIGLGVKACMEGYSVLFTSVPRLVTQLREAKESRSQTVFENRFEKYDLVICDEFGYISFDKASAEMLFSLLSIRTDNKSTIITTNLGFDRWTEIFHDKVLTAAMVDRLNHQSIYINMNGESYRMKKTKENLLANTE
ncbi:AAA family ATPase [Flammeovirga pectinis]|uniref:AAA family ATPase n=1 Tax=Flammeovirga pectinis TaxID=2494373 RepID=A0A3Q9FSQ3_9BACT|nr:IS21-like element helper ATPase IstB [Flammeovirga pectinis]AZQ64722.1 AAA family ATPase [Flammeovirga pectinis]AZQ65181.1 AAA family ATPase [Flammeovirga pectinis]AZQ65378.1 AAA family ATPase [Flammeovirga pectinis]